MTVLSEPALDAGLDTAAARRAMIDSQLRPSGVNDARVPLLVIFGTADEIVEPEAADRWKKDVPRARVVKMHGVGHSPHWERPRQVTQLLLDYAR
jgi:pimeloyl-ACP methyl ester carboxylesterase